MQNLKKMMLAVAVTLPLTGYAEMPVPLIDGQVDPVRSGVNTASQPYEAHQPVQGTGQVSAEEAVSRFGKIVDRKLVGSGGLTAWTVERNGTQLVLYTTPDVAVMFAGVAFDPATGRNLSADPGKPQLTTAATAPAARPVAALDGEFTGAIPESMKTVDSLAGVKEGKGGIADTVYVVVDPRCPYCRTAYNRMRPYVNKGYSVKWIPTTALGNSQDGAPLVATVLQSENDSDKAKVLGGHDQIRTQPTQQSIDEMQTSLDFLLAAYKNNGGEQAGVPTAFFIDRRTGKARMLSGVSEQPVLDDIFGHNGD